MQQNLIISGLGPFISHVYDFVKFIISGFFLLQLTFESRPEPIVTYTPHGSLFLLIHFSFVYLYEGCQVGPTLAWVPVLSFFLLFFIFPFLCQKWQY